MTSEHCNQQSAYHVVMFSVASMYIEHSRLDTKYMDVHNNMPEDPRNKNSTSKYIYRKIYKKVCRLSSGQHMLYQFTTSKAADAVMYICINFMIFLQTTIV